MKATALPPPITVHLASGEDQTERRGCAGRRRLMELSLSQPVRPELCRCAPAAFNFRPTENWRHSVTTVRPHASRVGV